MLKDVRILTITLFISVYEILYNIKTEYENLKADNAKNYSSLRRFYNQRYHKELNYLLDFIT